MNLPKIVICCEFVVNDVKNVLFVVIGRELCPGLFFSDREEKDPPGALPVELEKLSRSESTGAGRVHGEPVRLSETPHGETVRDSPRGKQKREPVRTSRSSPRTGSGRGAGQSLEVGPGAWSR
jgi:hypothetical protein